MQGDGSLQNVHVCLEPLAGAITKVVIKDPGAQVEFRSIILVALRGAAVPDSSDSHAKTMNVGSAGAHEGSIGLA